ncbi:hypothetical protein KSP40_PGU005520 [Platanthera guangdongensis]|uniref:Uncharacterized protein n=1 Tax=Platanthera guangdongensis TaxID=2320717 RepID=A0ABR2LWM6_9ASPA
MDLQSFHLFLLTLHQKLKGLFWILESIVSRNSGEHEKNESQNSISPRSRNFGVSTPLCKERLAIESHADSIDSESHKNTPRPSPRGESEQCDTPNSTSYGSKGNWSDKYFKGSGDQFHRSRLTMKLRDFQKFVNVKKIQCIIE